MYSQPKMELKTEKGLKYFFYGLILYCTWQLISVILFFIIRDDLIEFIERQSENDPKAFEVIQGYIGPLCGFVILIFIVILLIFMGLIFLFTSRGEFGKVHTKNLEKSLALLLIGFFTSFIVSMIPNEISIVSGLISSICYSLGFIFMLKLLLDEQALKFLFGGAHIFTFIYIINSCLLLLTSTNADIFGYSNNYFLIGLAFIAVSILPWAIFSLSFYIAWKRIQWGLVKPIYSGYPPPYLMPPAIPMGMPTPPQPPRRGHKAFHNAKKCPSCGFMLEQQKTKCTKCGYYFGEE